MILRKSRLSHTLSPAAIVVAVACVSWVCAVPAVAAEDSYDGDGLWYFDWNGIQGFHDQGIDGSGVTIAMIDSPINVDVPTLQGANITPIAPLGCDEGQTPPATSTDATLAAHGTAVASFIVGSGAGYAGQTGVKGIAPGATLLAYATEWDKNSATTCGDDARFTDPTSLMSRAINDAVDRGADIITVSQGVTPSDELIAALANALSHHVIVVAALPNHDADRNLGVGAPFELNGVLSVGAVLPDGQPVTAAEGGPTTDIDTDVLAPGWDLLTQGFDGTWEHQSLEGGTSFATPITAAELALALQANPTATPNQILQALIHNTGTNGAHDVIFDSDHRYGYGTVDAISLLGADPTQYDDVNPFIEQMSRYAASINDPSQDELIWGPTADQIANYAANATPNATPSTQPSTTPGTNTTDDTNTTTLLILGGGIVLLLLIATGITIAIITTRKTKENPHA